MAEVELRSVAKRFGAFTALHNVDLTIRDDQLTVLLGPSGCGKSTLLRLIAGLEDVSEGEIAIAGRVVNDVDASRRGCAMVFQNYALYPHKTVADNIAFPLRMAGVPRETIRTRVNEVADVLELGALLHRLPRDLSGGQRQRVAMGRAMIREPSVYLFDEPLSNLDAELRVKMRLEISRLRDRLSATMIFVTHDQVEAMTLAHTVVVMSNGRVEQVGSPLEVYERPANRFVAGFIGTPAMSFLPVEAMEQSGEGRRLTIAGGATLDVPFALPDKPGSIGVRPEHARLGEPGHGRPISVKGRLETLGIEHLGDRSHAFLAGPFGEITVLRPESDEPLDPDLPLTVNVDRLHFFDAEGRRFGAAA